MFIREKKIIVHLIMPYYPIYLRKTAQHLQTRISSYSTATIWWFFILYI